MRIETTKPIMLKNKLLGGDKPLICVPLVSAEEASLINEIDKVINMNPDIVEWRADYYEDVMCYPKVDNILKILKNKTGEIPVIFTCRSHKEGGYRKIEDETKVDLLTKAIASGCIDVVDVELSFGKDNIDTIKSLTIQNGVKLILSYHDFSETPAEEFIIEKIKDEINLGADICKITVMPKDQGDVLKLLNATYKARKEVRNPLVAVSMGSLGTISRLAGWMFGSDITFAAGIKASAPGQIPIEQMRMMIGILERNLNN